MKALKNKPSITIAICTLGRGDILLNTLSFVLPQSKELNAEVLVIDQQFNRDNYTDQLLSLMNQNGEIRWHLTPNDSLTGKRNIALHLALADIVLFIDDDVIIPPGFIKKHIITFDDARISGATGQVYHAIDPSCPPTLEDPSIYSRRHFIESNFMRTGSLIGCNFSIRKAAAVAVGGFDERFIGSSQCEDFDFSDRLVHAGYSLIYDPSLWLIHLRAQSGGTRGKNIWNEWTRTANIFLYMFRHAATHSRAGLLWRALRTGPLRKEVVLNPFLWLQAWLGCIKGLRYGWKNRRFISAPISNEFATSCSKEC